MEPFVKIEPHTQQTVRKCLACMCTQINKSINGICIKSCIPQRVFQKAQLIRVPTAGAHGRKEPQVTKVKKIHRDKAGWPEQDVLERWLSG